MVLPVTEFAPAKINLALHVLGRRADGYHELDSIVAFADVGDELSFTPAADFSLAATGPFAHLLPGPGDNIITKVWRALGASPMAISLVKNLPVSAGIGGGSANAAATCRAFQRLTGRSPDIALSLGADIPVCIISRAARMQGMGERVTPLDDFAPLHAVLANPGIEMNTAAVFRNLALASNETFWRNDLTPAAAALAPEIATVLNTLQSQPGIREARMSGSGTTCFGIFDNSNAARTAAAAMSTAHPSWWIRQTMLR